MLALILALTHALPAQWNRWKYERTIELRGATGTVSVIVPPSLYGNAQPTLADVRLVSAGRTVPFTVVTPPPADDVRWAEATVQDIGYVAGRYSQAVGDFGVRESPIDELDIATPEQSFSATVAVDASDNGHTWRTIRTNAPIYDYAKDGLATNVRVAIPPTTSRYIRVRVASSTPFVISGLRGAEGAHATRPLERYQTHLERVARNGATAIYSVTGLLDVPIERLDVSSSTASYAREAELQSGGAGWQTIASATLEHTPRATNTTLAFGEAQAARWRLRIRDGDNAPLQDLRAYAYGAPRRIVFDARRETSYVLVYGNPGAAPAQFDYAQTHGSRRLQAAPAVALGAPFLNPNFVPAAARAPWTERHRALLWIALGIVALAIATIALRVLRSDDVTR